MGNIMKPFGNWGDFPESFMPPTFDQNLGFPNGRKERVMIATEEEMKAAKVPEPNRDYCAHKFIAHSICQRKHLPMFVKCKKEKHEYYHCLTEDYTLRMKEYERERRLARKHAIPA
ncbi:NADH dehydrogenase (ubiquinone) B18 subunit [Ptiloglossa arizonensis]|uniref:NADH dehydrogenase (ubiquinone) B18 subunit n=1 Tax=Ptiloglossa arizonensis TaxID=3350558 RepID=UPI003F9FB7D2